MTAPDFRPTSERAAFAGIWVVAGKMIARGFDFATLLILARLLSPADFGLVAIAMTVIFIVEAILELPMVQALMRVSEPTEAMFSTAFTLGLLRGLLITLLVAALAWPLAVFYGEPRLVALLLVLALAPGIRGLVSPRMIVFMQRFDFRREFALDIVGKGTALVVSVGVALATDSYWAIVAGTISTPLAATILSFCMAPIRPRLTLSQWAHFRDMVGWNSAAQIVSAVNWQIDRILLPRFVDLSTYGRYSVASNLSALPFQALIQPLARPLMAAFSPLTSKTSLGLAYCKASNAMMLTAAPMLIGMGVLSETVLRIAVGQEWVAAAPILRWMALSAVVTLPAVAMPALAMAMDRTRYVTFRMLFELVVKLPAMLLGILFFGLMGALVAQALAASAMLLASMFVVHRLTGLSMTRQFAGIWRPAVAAVPMIGLLVVARPYLDAVPTGIGLVAAALATGLAAAATFYATAMTLWLLAGRPAGAEAVVASRLRHIRARLAFGVAAVRGQ